MTRKFGWVKDAPDGRDRLYLDSYGLVKKLPAKADLRRQLPPVYDQGDMNACTANAIAAAIEFDEIRQKMTPRFIPSRLFIYFNERTMEGTVQKDAGGQIRDGIKSVAKRGVPEEKLWKYDKKLLKLKPPPTAFDQARQYKTLNYARMMHRLEELKSCLASGFPFIVGLKVFASFVGQEVVKMGIVNMPKKREKGVGLHAAIVCGYDDANQRFMVRNSFGTDWGMDGYFTLPYSYLLDSKISHDFWTIRLIR